MQFPGLIADFTEILHEAYAFLMLEGYNMSTSNYRYVPSEGYLYLLPEVIQDKEDD